MIVRITQIEQNLSLSSLSNTALSIVFHESNDHRHTESTLPHVLNIYRPHNYQNTQHIPMYSHLLSYRGWRLN